MVSRRLMISRSTFAISFALLLSDNTFSYRGSHTLPMKRDLRMYRSTPPAFHTTQPPLLCEPPLRAAAFSQPLELKPAQVGIALQ